MSEGVDEKSDSHTSMWRAGKITKTLSKAFALRGKEVKSVA